jgi:hypothetical protein
MATSRHLWTRDLLASLLVPGSLQNTLALIAQIQAEGGGALFNPLNTTLPMPGATDYNSVHVKNYLTYSQGVTATANTLRQSNMRLLLDALKKADSAKGYWVALAASPWGTVPPGGMTIDAFLADIRTHWMARVMVPIAGT